MPAAPVLLAGGRVLGAADVAAAVGLRDADVAADALADLVEPALVDLARQERVGDRRAGGSDQVPDAAADRSRPSGRDRSAGPTPTIGLRGRLAHARGALELPALAKKRDGPESCDHSPIEPTFTSQRSTRWSARRTNSSPSSRSTPSAPRAVDRHPAGDRAVVADRRRAPPRASRARTAPGSRASRRSRRCGGCSAARGTARAGRCARRRRRRCRSRRRASAAPPRTQSSCTRRMSRLVIACGTTPVAKSLGDLRRRRRRQPRLAVLAVRARVRELDPGQRAVGVRLRRTSPPACARRGRPTCAPRRTASRRTRR